MLLLVFSAGVQGGTVDWWGGHRSKGQRAAADLGIENRRPKGTEGAPAAVANKAFAPRPAIGRSKAGAKQGRWEMGKRLIARPGGGKSRKKPNRQNQGLLQEKTPWDGENKNNFGAGARVANRDMGAEGTGVGISGTPRRGRHAQHPLFPSRANGAVTRGPQKKPGRDRRWKAEGRWGRPLIRGKAGPPGQGEPAYPAAQGAARQLGGGGGGRAGQAPQPKQAETPFKDSGGGGRDWPTKSLWGRRFVVRLWWAWGPRRAKGPATSNDKWRPKNTLRRDHHLGPAKGHGAGGRGTPGDERGRGFNSA